LAPLVLVVEDDRDIREALIEVLDEAGYETAGAADGHEAMAFLRRRSKHRLPALLLVDLRMPGMDGHRLQAELSLDPVLARLPIIVVTADGEAAARSVRGRARAVLTKPLRLDILLATVGAVAPLAARG